jgi:protein-disulfide isomerase
MSNVSQPLESVIPADHVLGEQRAPITLIEYGDFECPICKQAAPAIKLLLQHFPGQVRVVFRHFPLEDVHPNALAAAEASEVAGAQGKFWEMHDVLFEHQLHLKKAQVHGYAERVGLDMTRYAAEMDDEIYRQRIREHIDGGRRSGVRGTPGIFINGVIHDASAGMQSVFDQVAALLRR